MNTSLSTSESPKDSSLNTTSILDRELALEMLTAIQKMEDSVSKAAGTSLWNFNTAQALIPGRNALFTVKERLEKELGLHLDTGPPLSQESLRVSVEEFKRRAPKKGEFLHLSPVLNPLPILNLPHHRTYLDAITSSVPRSRALVRMEDTPFYTTWVYLRSQGKEYRAINPLVHYWLLERPQIKLRHVKMHIEKWRGIHGSAGR